MDESKEYRRFKLIFHLFILIFALGLFVAAIAGKAPLYLILGIVFAGESIFGLYKNSRKVPH